MRRPPIFDETGMGRIVCPPQVLRRLDTITRVAGVSRRWGRTSDDPLDRLTWTWPPHNVGSDLR
jgi:hypothetical protein